jgi:hypothetical protein
MRRFSESLDESMIIILLYKIYEEGVITFKGSIYRIINKLICYSKIDHLVRMFGMRRKGISYLSNLL